MADIDADPLNPKPWCKIFRLLSAIAAGKGSGLGLRV